MKFRVSPFSLRLVSRNTFAFKTRRLTVCDLNSYDNQFDGLACFLTVDCLFTNLYLHDNPGAGISLDGNFNHNIIETPRSLRTTRASSCGGATTISFAT